MVRASYSWSRPSLWRTSCASKCIVATRSPRGTAGSSSPEPRRVRLAANRRTGHSTTRSTTRRRRDIGRSSADPCSFAGVLPRRAAMLSRGASKKRGVSRISAGAVWVPRVAVIMADPILPSATSRSNRASQSTGVELVDGQRRLIQGEPADLSQGQGSVQTEQCTGAEPEDELAPAVTQQCFDFLTLDGQTVVITRWPTGPTSSPIWNVDREVAGERTRQIHQILRGLPTAVDENQTGTVPQLSVADRRPVSRRHAPSQISRRHDGQSYALCVTSGRRAGGIRSRSPLMQPTG